MEKRTRNLLIAGAVAVVLVIIVINAGQRERADVSVDDGDPALGSGNLTVFLFEDYQCPHCGNYALGPNYQHLLDTWVAPGHVTVVFKHAAFVGPYSEGAAVASRCVHGIDADAWPAWDHDVYALQQQQTQPTPQALRTISDAHGIDLDAYDACIDDADVADAVQETEAERDALGIGTPTIIVDGQPYNPNDLDALDAAIEDALAA